MTTLLKQINNLERIEVNFFESGHNQSEVDSIHSTIEGRCTGKEIYHPSEYYTLTANACHKNPIKVIELTTEAPLYDFKQHSKTFVKNKGVYFDISGDENGPMKVNWLFVKRIIIAEEKLPLVGFSYNYNDDDLMYVNILTARKPANSGQRRGAPAPRRGAPAPRRGAPRRGAPGRGAPGRGAPRRGAELTISTDDPLGAIVAQLSEY